MQLYKVKLDNPSLSPDANVNGYLAVYEGLALYSRGEAIKKAKSFGGKIEKHGKNYTTNEVKILQLAKQEISQTVINELVGRVVYIDTTEGIENHIYYGDVFAAILEENSERTLLPISIELQDELYTLNELCGGYEYVTLM